jgi:8-oxo-dGTP diphosphatase
MSISTANNSTNVHKRPLVGVGVLIVKNGRLLLAKRTNSHGNNCWAPIGGHLEYGESPEECTVREVREEVGIIIKNISRFSFTNDIFFDEHKHYISIFLLADSFVGQPIILEPEKCAQLEFFAFDNLPTPLFLPLENLIDQLRGTHNFEQLIMSKKSS